MSVTVVSTSEIRGGRRPSRKVKDTLARQGLIEPLAVRPAEHVQMWELCPVHGDIYDPERLTAARILGWDTVIIYDCGCRSLRGEGIAGAPRSHELGHIPRLHPLCRLSPSTMEDRMTSIEVLAAAVALALVISISAFLKAFGGDHE